MDDFFECFLVGNKVLVVYVFDSPDLFAQPVHLFLVLLAQLFSPVHGFSLRVLQKVVQLSGIISLEIIFILVPVDFVDDGKLLLLEVAQVELSSQRLSCAL